MSLFICPNCKKKLEIVDRSYLCINRHCFDKAKEGYVNLMPINSKKTKDPGDNSKMTLARRSFLESNNYKPLVEKITDLIIDLLKDRQNPNIFDLGCGEGYYTGILADQLPNSYIISALDISKVAVRYGSKRYKDVNFCVASAFEMPVADNSIDLLYRIYAPSSDTELNRVIKKDGYLITVTPGNRHLYQLREIIYKEVLNLSTKNDESKTLKLLNSESLHYTMNIRDGQMVQNLLDMTPFGWKISKNNFETLISQKEWNIECDFKIDVYKKN
ncbi:MAG: 23S rRNA (guanine(745)-N(1))-methyltransferase [Spirochaetaceae bacterium]